MEKMSYKKESLLFIFILFGCGLNCHFIILFLKVRPRVDIESLGSSLKYNMEIWLSFQDNLTLISFPYFRYIMR
jgi:hypothetical protein